MKDFTSFVRWFSADERKCERQPAARSITCSSMGPSGNPCGGATLSANVLDISDDGMCIRTNCPFEPGHVLRVQNVTEQLTGIVRWSASEPALHAYRLGVQFVAPGEAPAHL